jgi:hypothetical protein
MVKNIDLNAVTKEDIHDVLNAAMKQFTEPQLWNIIIDLRSFVGTMEERALELRSDATSKHQVMNDPNSPEAKQFLTKAKALWYGSLVESDEDAFPEDDREEGLKQYVFHWHFIDDKIVLFVDHKYHPFGGTAFVGGRWLDNEGDDHAERLFEELCDKITKDGVEAK